MIAFLALAAALPTGLVDALMREKRVADCARTQSEYTDTVLPASRYLAQSFEVRKVTLTSRCSRTAGWRRISRFRGRHQSWQRGTYSLDVDGSDKSLDLHNFKVELSIH